MNDRYMFRAKRTDNGEWVEGYLIYDKFDNQYRIVIDLDYSTGTCIQTMMAPRVDHSTICQCTGLKKLFEKDIVERTDIHKVGEMSIGIIEYDVENTAFVIHWIDREKYSPMYPWKDKIKVIGNIFDNTELLEVGE